MIIYIHGFNSDATYTNKKVQVLQKHFPKEKILPIRYDSFASKEVILKSISEQLSSIAEDVTLVVGTSLGGYFAASLASLYRVPSVLINPCIEPRKLLKQVINKIQTNFVTAEKNTLTDKVVESYIDPISNSLNDYAFIPLILLSKDDEVLDYKETKVHFPDFPILIGKFGGHRFKDFEILIPQIKSYLIHCEYASVLS